MRCNCWEFSRTPPMATDDFFRARLQTMIDLRHPLAVLAARLPRPGIEAALSVKFEREDRAPKSETIGGLFGVEAIDSGGGISSAGRPRRRGRPPIGVSRMLRMYFLQQWYTLADAVLEDALYDSQAMREFVGIELGAAMMVASTTVPWRISSPRCARCALTSARIAAVRSCCSSSRRNFSSVVASGTFSRPRSTKNEEGKRDPGMHQTKKGNQWCFGMKMPGWMPSPG